MPYHFFVENEKNNEQKHLPAIKLSIDAKLI